MNEPRRSEEGRNAAQLYEIGLSASPRFVAVDEASGKIYVTHPGENIVSVLVRAASAG